MVREDVERGARAELGKLKLQLEGERTQKETFQRYGLTPRNLAAGWRGAAGLTPHRPIHRQVEELERLRKDEVAAAEARGQIAVRRWGCAALGQPAV
jgi:hypothetical protein